MQDVVTCHHEDKLRWMHSEHSLTVGWIVHVQQLSLSARRMYAPVNLLIAQTDTFQPICELCT